MCVYDDDDESGTPRMSNEITADMMVKRGGTMTPSDKSFEQRQLTYKEKLSVAKSMKLQFDKGVVY